MQKNIGKHNKRDIRRAATVEETAGLLGISKNYVQKVMRGDRENDEVVAVFMELSERKNYLLEEVKKLVPFNN
ncbi:MAG: hypothetical protein ABS68_00080 [Niastella sp. SCN 39-18]|nr:hypothetical protein [Sphingobacteriales bacterium]ODT55150.1 MAG: hypothetical protein ABS68_00080 [Niastella sp. SCN 39-18]OJW09138.1 MAG: hypothetical protein BGO53_00325 [Sphingobacteriales bacterium 39-19]